MNKEEQRDYKRAWYLANREKSKAKALAWYYANRERAIARVSKWNRDNAERFKERSRKRKSANREKIAAQNKTWNENNKHYHREWREKNREICRARYRDWYAKNKEKVYANLAIRRARELGQTPTLNKDESQQIKALYAKAIELSKLHGEPYHVDHIYPLARGGLHHPSNLRIIRGIENQKKWAHLPICKDGALKAFF